MLIVQGQTRLGTRVNFSLLVSHKLSCVFIDSRALSKRLTSRRLWATFVHFWRDLNLQLVRNLGPVQTWCPCPCPVPGHQSEQSLALVPGHRFGHRARARVLAPEVVLGQGTDLNRFLSVPDVFTFSHATEALTPNLSPISR